MIITFITVDITRASLLLIYAEAWFDLLVPLQIKKMYTSQTWSKFDCTKIHELNTIFY